MVNTIELAKSSRSSCKICKDKIEKGIPRFGKESIFKSGGKEYASMHWHHFDCAAKKYPKELVGAELKTELSVDMQKILDELKQGMSSSAFDVKTMDKFSDPDRKVNLNTIVGRAMKVKEMEDYNGDVKIGRSIYILEKKLKSKLYLWDKLAASPVEKGDTLIVINALTKRAGNNNIQFHTTSCSKVLINPTEDELSKYTKSIEIFEATTWDRPSGKAAEVQYAKSSRAVCKICEVKIMKGTLKIIKPIWSKNDDRAFPSADSFHINCATQDINGEDLIHEVISRLTPELITNEYKIFKDLLNILPPIKARDILEMILD